jgi:DNA-directed RNA polymerase subunit RPC12/RpoP
MIAQEFTTGARLRHLLYRCYRCTRILTSLEIERSWAKGEKANEGVPVENQVAHPQSCPCGSRHLTPTNASLWEELTRPSIWWLWYKRVFLPWLRG